MPSRAPTVPDPLLLPGQPPLPVRRHGSRPGRAPAPLVLHLHGGSFIAGGLDSGASFAQLLADAGAVVLSIAYPLAPAHPFPQALEAAYAALGWMAGARTRLAGARAPLFVAGEEAGGNLAAALAMVVRDRAELALAGQILVTPMLDPCTAMPSQREAVGAEVHCRWSEGWRQYLRSPMDAEHPYAVPASAQRLAGVAPALVLAGEDDPMRDEAVAYARRLEQAGIAVRHLLIPATGWPASLEAPPHPCPCAAVVTQLLRDFLAAPEPPS